MGEKKKLNLFQRGIFQILAFVVVYAVSLGLAAYLADSFEKWRFIFLVESAQRQGVITPEGFQFIKNLIESMGWVSTFLPLGIGGLCLVAGWYAMRWTLNQNWSWPVTLERAIEFRSGMRKLGIVDPKDWIPFIAKYNLSVFITISSLTTDTTENVRARQYKRAPNTELVDKKIFDLNAGRQTLCLDADEYEAVAKKLNESVARVNSAMLAEKNAEIKGLNAALARVIQEKESLTKERDELRAKVRIQPAQEDTRVDRLRVEHLLWSGYIPVMERLLREAPDGKKYITKEIEAEVNAEWEHRPDLRERMKKLTGSEEAFPSESFMKAVKAEFKAQGKFSSGGRPTKNP